MGRKPEKKWGTLFFVKKQVAKKRVIVIQKEKRQPDLFSFPTTMTLFFAPCFLAKSRVPDFLKVPDPKKISGRPDKLNIRVQIDWASVSINAPLVSLYLRHPYNIVIFCLEIKSKV